jgi:hypothetical protein
LGCNLGVRRGGTALKRGRRSTEVGVCLGVEETLACRAAEGGVHRALASAPGDHRGLRAAQLRYRAASASSSPRSIRSSSRPRPPRACHEHGPARGRPGGRPEARRPGRRPGRPRACARQRRALPRAVAMLDVGVAGGGSHTPRACGGDASGPSFSLRSHRRPSIWTSISASEIGAHTRPACTRASPPHAPDSFAVRDRRSEESAGRPRQRPAPRPARRA